MIELASGIGKIQGHLRNSKTLVALLDDFWHFALS